MSPTFIIDCSMTMAWFFPDEATTATQEIQDRLVNEAVLVPSLWFLEVTNVLAMAEKRKRTTPKDATQFLQLLQKFDIQAEESWQQCAFDHILPLCRKHGLTTYDASYLDLALCSQLPLASLDIDLKKAAKTLGIPLL
ncbi:MAG: type II toxin-antitoxin system VapC family toxin [Gemmatales bacterium]